MLAFALLNESTTTDPLFGGPLTDAILEKIAAACELQLNTHLAFVWGGEYAVRPVKARSDVSEFEVPIVIRDTLPEVPDAAGYHTLAGGQPAIYIARYSSSELIRGPGALSVTVSHECNETGVDPPVNRWAEDEHGTEYAMEVSDPTESYGYEVAGVYVSDFVYPEYFWPGSKGPYSYLSKPPAPFQIADAQGGDYQIVRMVNLDGTRTVMARGNVPHAKRRQKGHASSRSYRRGLRV